MKPAQRIGLIVAASAAIAGSAFLAVHATRIARKPEQATVAVVRADLRHSIAVTGSVKASSDVALAFERGGTVSRVYAKVGDKVRSGQVVATLGAAELAAQLSQAEAAQAAAEARLAAVKRGARAEEVGVQDAAVRAATTSLAEARRGLVDKLQDAYGKADDAVFAKTDQFFVAPTSATPSLAFFIPDQRLSDDLGWRRYLLGETLAAWRDATASLAVDGDLDAAVTDARARLETVRGFLDDCALALDKVSLATNPSLAQPSLDGYKAAASAARANVLASGATLSSGLEKVRVAAAALDLASTQKDYKVAAPAAEDVAVQEAAVRQAEAAVEAVRAQLAKVSLRAPIDGVVTRQDAKVGSSAAPGIPLVTVQGDGLFVIEAIVPEADVAGVRTGEDATVTLDAYGTGVPFTATVVALDPAPSSADGVTGYKTTLRFRDADERIKAGMTANASIIAGTRSAALAVPREAVIARDGSSFVLAARGDGEAPVERKVSVGLVGDDGLVEITDGLSEGDRVVGFGDR